MHMVKAILFILLMHWGYHFSYTQTTIFKGKAYNYLQINCKKKNIKVYDTSLQKIKYLFSIGRIKKLCYVLEYRRKDSIEVVKIDEECRVKFCKQAYYFYNSYVDNEIINPRHNIARKCKNMSKRRFLKFIKKKVEKWFYFELSTHELDNIYYYCSEMM